MNTSQMRRIPRPSRARLKSTTVLPMVLGLGVAGASLGLAICSVRPAKAAPPAMTLRDGRLPEAKPRDVRLVACNPCTPCAAAACNPCNPCAAAACSPCNPCAAAAGNPCNPCNPCAAAASSPCNPCNPCAAGGGVELTDAQAAGVYDCVKGHMQAAYGAADDPAAGSFLSWPHYSLVPYVSGTHGGRYVMNYANPAGAAYGKYESAGTLPAGTKLAKNSFVVGAGGKVSLGPLFLMEKMAAGFNDASGDWRYTMIMPDGSTFGSTKGTNAAGVAFCSECHAIVAEEQDYLYFLPEEYRIAKN